jgi:uncharacterized protein YceH (UPF0502 family)
MHPFADLQAVGATLTRLIDRGLVARLDRRPGQKEERYRELLGEDAEDVPVATAAGGVAAATAVAGNTGDARVEGAERTLDTARPATASSTAELESRLASVERAVAELAGERLARLERDLVALREALGG